MAATKTVTPFRRRGLDDSATPFFLLARARNWHDCEAWTKLERWARPRIVRECVASRLNSTEAEDMAQDVLYRMATSLKTFVYDSSKSFRAWLKTTTRRLIYDRFSKQQAYFLTDHLNGPIELLVDPTSVVTSKGDETWEASRWHALIAWAEAEVKRSNKQSSWNAFWLTEIEGMSTSEVAEKLGMSAGAVRAARFRVRNQLQRLGNQQPE